MPICPKCGRENPQDARFCNGCAALLTAPGPNAGEERKVITVLFCDLVGFTARSDRADPEDVRATLRPYHERVRREIERFGGTVEKLVGDGVMAVFGAPVAHEDDAERAVRAALRILEAVPELSGVHEGLDLQVRIGINTGEAVVALGARPSEVEGIVGDVVNTAARLQGVAPIGSAVVGEVTYRATRDAIHYQAVEPVAVKGKAEPVPIWRVLEARSRFGVDVEQPAVAPLIGREDDLALLRQTFARTLRGSSVQLVTVTGEPGVGKSRLVSEFRQFVDDQPEVVYWRQGRCLPYGEGITFWALGEVVKAHAGILESDDPNEAWAKLTHAVDAVVSDPSEREWMAGRLSPLVGAGRPGPGGVERAESFAAWQRFLEAIAAVHPLALVFEDLHWADPAIVEFIEHLTEWSAEVSILVIGTARPELYERYPGWGGGKRNSTTIALSPLSDEDTARLVSALLEQSVLPAPLQAALIERAGGNPLYAEESVRMLVDQGALERRGRSLILITPMEQIPFPENVQALIAARLDTLPPKRKALLQDAAVVGKVFWSGAVAFIGHRDEAEVHSDLHELSKKELVRLARRSTVQDEAEYSFWHLLIRDVAYGQIPRAARAAKHRLAAEWLEQLAEDRVTDLAELLAYHYGQALELSQAAGADQEVPDLERRAVRFLIVAGDRAINLDVAKATSYYRRALELLPEAGPQVPAVEARLAEAAVLLGEFAEALPLYEGAIAGFQAKGDGVAQGEAMANMAYALWNQGEGARSRERLARAVAVLEREPPGPQLLAAYEQMGALTYLGGGARDGLEWSEKALALARKLGREDRTVRALQVHGMARFELGDHDGLDDLREALRRALELGLGHETVRSYINLAALVFQVEGPREFVELTRQAVEVAKRRGITFRGMWASWELVWGLSKLGQWDGLLVKVEELIEWDDAHGGSQIGQFARANKMHLLARQGRLDEAEALAPEVLDGVRRIGDPQVLVPDLTFLAELEVARGRPSAAVEHIREVMRATEGRPHWRAEAMAGEMRVLVAAGALEMAKELLSEVPEAPTVWQRNQILTARAVHAEGGGELEHALELYLEAANRWAEFEVPLEQAQALLGAGRCLVALGRETAMLEPLSQAREIFARLGARPLLQETDALLERATAMTS